MGKEDNGREVNDILKTGKGILNKALTATREGITKAGLDEKAAAAKNKAMQVANEQTQAAARATAGAVVKLGKKAILSNLRQARDLFSSALGPAGEDGNYSTGQITGSEIGKIIGRSIEKVIYGVRGLTSDAVEKIAVREASKYLPEVDSIKELLREYSQREGNFSGDFEESSTGIVYSITKKDSSLEILCVSEGLKKSLIAAFEIPKEGTLVDDYEQLINDLKQRILNLDPRLGSESIDSKIIIDSTKKLGLNSNVVYEVSLRKEGTNLEVVYNPKSVPKTRGKINLCIKVGGNENE